MINPIPRPQLADFISPRNGLEVLRYEYFSRKPFVAGVFPTETLFFSDVVGVGGATERTTNMRKASTIPNPNRFLAQFLTFRVFTVVKADMVTAPASVDAEQIINNTLVRVEVDMKEYRTLQTAEIPSGIGMWTNPSSTLARMTFGNGVPEKRQALAIEICLEREVTFAVKLKAPETFTTTQNLLAEFTLHGLLLRPVM